MSGFKSIRSLATVISKAPKALEKRKLRRYSWIFDVFTIEGSIIMRVIGPVLTVTIFAAAVATASEVYGKHVNLSNNVVPLLSIVVGLILVFRNGTSYDRYYEGRRDFGAMVSVSRSLARNIWIQVIPSAKATQSQPAPSHGVFSGGFEGFLGVKGSDYQHSPTSGSFPSAEANPYYKLRQEKIRALRLIISFAYAVVHHLRNEPGTDYEDYIGVLPPGFSHAESVVGVDRTTMSNQYKTYASTHEAQVGEPSSSAGATMVARKSPKTNRILSLSKVREGHGHAETSERTALLTDDHTTVEFHPYSSAGPTIPLPLVIAHELSLQLFKWRKAGNLEVPGPAGHNTMSTQVSSMIDQLTAMERVATTPIPPSYGIHLKQCVSMYLFTLPFTLINDMKWRMVPIVTVVAFTLMGIEGIADEIEMPFGKDKSDLPLDKFSADLRAEIEYIIERLPDGSEESSNPFSG